jgi:hypothetical protein
MGQAMGAIPKPRTDERGVQHPFLPSDVHFYGMIFHDWPPETCWSLPQNSFESLPTGGRIVIHEMLFNDDRTGPFPVAVFNVDMLVAMPGQQYSGQELNGMLADARFKDMK